MGVTDEDHSRLKGGFTIEGAVEWSGFSRTRIYAEIGNGTLVAKKAGRRTIIMGASLQALIDNLPAAKIRAPKQAA
jgi:hypothetical protein